MVGGQREALPGYRCQLKSQDIPSCLSPLLQPQWLRSQTPQPRSDVGQRASRKGRGARKGVRGEGRQRRGCGRGDPGRRGDGSSEPLHTRALAALQTLHPSAPCESAHSFPLLSHNREPWCLAISGGEGASHPEGTEGATQVLPSQAVSSWSSGSTGQKKGSGQWCRGMGKGGGREDTLRLRRETLKQTRQRPLPL